MKLTKKLFALLLALSLALGLMAVPAAAAQSEEAAIEPFVYINPVYADVISQENVVSDFEISIISEPMADAQYLDVNGAGQVFRENMRSRNGSFTIYVASSVQSAQVLTSQILSVATAHTGVPTEGDYLAYQFASIGGGGQAYTKGSMRYYTLNYQVQYYTTAAQEKTVDAAVTSLMSQLNLGCKSEYQKIKIIYDYICDNVTYDYEHLNTDYKLQFTAYAALINKTAVCQGYANLFYRLCLEAGLDARLIPGTGNGGPHAWNIVRIGNVYYDMDATWDSNFAATDNYRYFLRTDANFGSHVRASSSTLGVNYTSSAFYSAYPMASADYDPNTMPQNSHHSASAVLQGYVAPTCISTGFSGNYCCSACGQVITAGKELPLGDHTYDSGVVTKAPTVISTGVRHHICTVCGVAYDATIPVLPNPFTDVKSGSYYYDPVLWALANGITTGTGATTFSPEATCTRAQVVTFLWRSAGEPVPASKKNPFADVAADSYYYTAVLWAVEKGITNGTGANAFSPNATCTRAQVVTFLHRAKGMPAPAGTAAVFADVTPGAFYATPVAWAVEQGITNGTSAATFGPGAACTRGQVVTFLYRAMH